VLAKYKDTKFLLASGFPDKINDVDAIQASGIELLAKPYRRARLAAAVEKTVSGTSIY
jgi:hypothetical protein